MCAYACVLLGKHQLKTVYTILYIMYFLPLCWCAPHLTEIRSSLISLWVSVVQKQNRKSPLYEAGIDQKALLLFLERLCCNPSKAHL